MKTKFKKDIDNLLVRITTEFNTPVDNIWEAYTKHEILEKWWAPQPFKAITKEMKFENGGQWLYYMLSPKGEKFWAIDEFRNIIPKKSFEVLDTFCDEKGIINTEFPRTNWINNFTSDDEKTIVVNELKFTQAEDLKLLIEMGFEEGYTIALNQLANIYNA